MSCPPHPLAPARPPYLQNQPRPLSYYRLVQLPNQHFISYCAASPRRQMPTLRSKTAVGTKEKETQTPARLKNVQNDSLSKYAKHRPATAVNSTAQTRADSSGSQTMKRAHSAYYQRAKSGYVYWPTEPKRMTHDLKRPFGSIGAVYGLGSGPRS